ncbi:amidohydrolase family protein [Xylophilus sp. Kf1]|nr:amidohydrolase family protein [Xylophilus sp. Kf1]
MPAAEAPAGPAAVSGVDSHAHVFERGLPLATRRRHAPDYDALLDDYLGLLDRHGLSHGVLVQPSFLGTDNHYWSQAVARHPQRLRGVAVVDPSISDDDLHRLAAQGTVGVRLNLVGLEIPDFSGAEWQALLARVRRRDWHVEIHRDAADLPAVLAALLPSGCRLVVDHFGRPDPLLGSADPGFAALLRSADSRQVWVKLSAAYRNARSPRAEPAGRTPSLAAQDAADARHCAAALLDAFGCERLVWGSDWPHTQHRDAIDFAASRAALDDWVPDATQRRRILVQTPAELFGFDRTFE